LSLLAVAATQIQFFASIVVTPKLAKRRCRRRWGEYGTGSSASASTAILPMLLRLLLVLGHAWDYSCMSKLLRLQRRELGSLARSHGMATTDQYTLGLWSDARWM